MEAPRKSASMVDGSPRSAAGGSRAAVILGNDAILAARPSSAAQLLNACVAAGFDSVAPPAWGDELVAGAYLAGLAKVCDHVVMACACPRVRAAIDRATATTTPREIAVVSPPVAAARYLRLIHGDSLLVTYVGDCPAADDPAIDAHFSPAGFFASLQRQGIALAAMPNAMSDADTARWQRYLSLPGGLPALRWLARPPVERVLREADASSVETGNWPTSRANILLDLAEAASCACGGNRTLVQEAEPVRSVRPIVIARGDLDLSPTPSPARSHLITAAMPVAVPEPSRITEPSASPERSSTEQPGVAVKEEPVASVSKLPASVSKAPAIAPLTAPVTTPRPKPARVAARAQPERSNRTAALAALPAIVIAVSAALGIVAYAAVSNGVTPAAAATGEPASPSTNPIPSGADSAIHGSGVAFDSVRADTTSAGATGADSLGRVSAPLADSVSTRVDSTVPSPAPRRPRRQRAPEIVPGWLPQGQKAWDPADSSRARKRDSSTVVPPAKPDSVPRA